MERMTINWPTGRMEIVLDEFFPCTQKNARILAPLVAENLDEDAFESLEQYLAGKAEMLERQAGSQKKALMAARRYRMDLGILLKAWEREGRT